jgi:TatD DNase family protein
MSRLPPLDLHAHIDPNISEAALDALDAVAFAVTRSLDEAEAALGRSDATTIWGVGCHPAKATAHASFAPERFRQLIEVTAFAGELGLDGRAGVPFDTQLETLRGALSVLIDEPRLVSLHNRAATEPMIDELERLHAPGRVLHWWLGDVQLTRRAVELGCYFSLPPAAIRRKDLLEAIPLERLLTETDHPFGDRSSQEPRPGNVDLVERALATQHRQDQQDIRRILWANLARLIRETGCGSLLPSRVRTILATLPPDDRQPRP